METVMKSVLVVGLGRFGRHFAQKMIEEGNEVMAVDISEERANAAVSIVNNILIGDITSEDFVDSLDINGFDICVVAIGDNFQAALEATVMLKDMGARYVISRASRDVHKKLLLRNGADYVVYGEREIAERLAMKYGADNVFDYIELTHDYSIYEIAVPSSWIGKSIVGAAVRTRYGVSILATKNSSGEFSTMPLPEHIFTPDETLMIIGHNRDIKKLLKS